MDLPSSLIDVELSIVKSSDPKTVTDFLCEDLTLSPRWKYLIPNAKDRAKVLPHIVLAVVKWVSQHGGGDIWEYRIKPANELIGVTAWLPPNIKVNIPFPTLVATAATSVSCLGPSGLQHLLKYVKKQEKFLKAHLSHLQGWHLYYIAASTKLVNSQDKILLYGKMITHPETEKMGTRPVVAKVDDHLEIFTELGFVPPKGELDGVFQPSKDSPILHLLVKYPIEKTDDIDNLLKPTASFTNTASPTKISLGAIPEGNVIRSESVRPAEEDWASLFGVSHQVDSDLGKYSSSSRFTLLFDDTSVSNDPLSPVVSLPTRGSLKILPAFKNRPTTCTRTNGPRFSSITILPTVEQWDRKSYYIMAQPEVYTTEVSIEKHYCWIIKHKTINYDGQVPFSLLFAYVKGFFIHWSQLSLKGYKQWSVEMLPDKRYEWLDKDKELSIPDATKYIKALVEDISLLQELRITDQISSEIKKIDSIRTINLKTLELGILYVGEGVKTIEKIVSKKNIASPLFEAFLPILGVPSEGNFQDGCKTSTWQGLTVNWLVGSQMKKDDRRRRIGNAMCLLLFYDSETPLDASTLFLGQVTNFVCVVQPGPKKNSKPTWKIGFFSHYEEKINSAISKECQISAQETYIHENLIFFPPDIPKNFLFDDVSLSEFILTKCFNARLQTSSKHNSVRLQFELPVGTQLEQFVKQVEPDWYSKVTK